MIGRWGMSPLARLALCAALAAAAIGGWLAFTGDPRGTPPVAANPASGSHEAGAALQTEDLAPIDPHPISERGDPVVHADRVEVSEASSAESKRGLLVILKGHIESARSDIERAVVSVQGEPSDDWNITPGSRPGRGSSGSNTPRARAEVNHDGTFEVDVTEVAQGARQLRVTAKHPNLKPRVELIATHAGGGRERVELYVHRPHVLR